jgi:phosphoglycolate phosphatase-like HAD superfamily hydrolase
MKNKLFLFDLDGTLLKVENTKMISIVDTALETSGFAQLKLKSKQFSGRTDHDIFLSYLADSDLVYYPTLKTAYLSELYNQLSPEDVALIDGVEEVSDWLVQAEVTWGVLTGNY